MSIEPETKDWTWVLRKECSECGEDVGQLSLADAINRLRELQDPWRVELEQSGLAVRPNDHTWSRLEYARHMRDALAVFRGRVELMLQHDEPTFSDWDQDAAAEVGNYNAADPTKAAGEVRAAIDVTIEMLSELGPDVIDRVGLRSDGAAFTVLSLTQYFVHDAAHHLVDLHRQR